MEGMNNGWGMGHGFYYIIGTVAFALIIWAVFKFTGENKNPKNPK